MGQKIEITDNSIVYVCCPAWVKTGGTELLHQYYKVLQQHSFKTEMVYISNDIKEGDWDKINPAFLEYTDSFITVTKIKDSKENVLIIPETYTGLLLQFANIQKVIWWESVDNYANKTSISYALSNQNYSVIDKLMTIGKVIKNHGKHLPLSKIKQVDFHFVQSEYARIWLKKYGVLNPFYVSDYINDTYVENIGNDTTKENLVLYNPSKGIRFTKKIIKKSKGTIQFVPICNMNNSQLVELFKKSKVYIDFGEHPGKDRLPREAASLGCIVITGRNGAAQNDKDLPILEEYKFTRTNRSLKDIIDCIHFCLNHYETKNADFDDYRKMIAGEKDQFIEDVLNCYHKTQAN